MTTIERDLHGLFLRPARGGATARLAWRALGQVLAWPGRVHRARQAMTQLGSMDDTQLRDIGLTRQDLRDTAALGLGADPTSLLRRRVAERRPRR